MTLAEADSSRAFEVKDVSLLIPCKIIELEACFVGDNDKRTMLQKHADKAGAAGSSIEPEYNRVVIGVSLGVEKDIVECASGEVQIS